MPELNLEATGLTSGQARRARFAREVHVVAHEVITLRSLSAQLTMTPPATLSDVLSLIEGMAAERLQRIGLPSDALDKTLTQAFAQGVMEQGGHA